jgi:hypothetical protein
MATRSDDATDLHVTLFDHPVTQPPSVDPGVLRRAMRYGERARAQFPGVAFHDAEAALRAGWFERGETTEWDWVRAAVRVGFEQDTDDEV